MKSGSGSPVWLSVHHFGGASSTVSIVVACHDMRRVWVSRLVGVQTTQVTGARGSGV